MGNIKSRALLYLYFVNLFIKKQSTPHHRDKQRKSRKRAVSNRPKKPILRQPLSFCSSGGNTDNGLSAAADILGADSGQEWRARMAGKDGEDCRSETNHYPVRI